MSRLCQDIHPGFSPITLRGLFRKSICTCLSFVKTNPEFLVRVTGLEYNQILEIKDVILKKFSSQLRVGDKCYQELLSHAAIISSGIENLDKLLDSGFVTGNIYELCGFAGSGKSQICMTIAINICTSNIEQQVFYIDTKNDILAQRLAKIAESRNIPNVGETLGKIQICQIRTSYDLLQELHQLQSRMNDNKKKDLGFRLMIIDSLSALFQGQYDQSESFSLLNHVANLLKFISVEYHVVVLLTNFVKSWTVEEMEGEEDEQTTFQEIQQPALGKYWAHVPNVRIMVKKLDDSNEYSSLLIVLKSPNQPAGKSVKVKLGDDGMT